MLLACLESLFSIACHAGTAAPLGGEEGGPPAGRDRAPRHRLRRMVQGVGRIFGSAFIVPPVFDHVEFRGAIAAAPCLHGRQRWVACKHQLCLLQWTALQAQSVKPAPLQVRPPGEQSGQHYRDRRRCRSGSGEESVPSAARASFHRRWGFGAGAAPHTVWALDSAVARPQPKIQRETPG